MKFENTTVWGFESALRGMRNPKESWEKSDTKIFNMNRYDDLKNYPVIIGPNDIKLAQTLILAGSEHRKFMRQIFVSVDITAPLYWWKEFDTYKVGTVANSTSTMHKIASKPITLDCFEIDDLTDINMSIPLVGMTETLEHCTNVIIDMCEGLRLKYLETKDKRYWKELIRWLPESWLQTRTVTMTYENLFAMCGRGQRRFHKLNEWSGQDNPTLSNFISWARTLPYAQEFIFIDEVKKTQSELLAEDGKIYRELLKEISELDEFLEGNQTYEDYYKVLEKYI